MIRRGPRKFRPWDVLLPADKVAIVRQRRAYPDGNKRFVSAKLVGGKEVNSYPWKEMKEGDFFEVEIKASREAMYTHFRQSAAVHDIEIVVVDTILDGKAGLMVTKILDGVTALKRRKGLPTFNIKAKYERIARHRKTKDGKPISFTTPRPKKIAAIIDTVNPIVGTGAGDFHDTYVEELAEKRRRALREAAGLDDDDEDIMGVTK